MDISVPIQQIHHDEAIYPDPLRYQPFRFAEADSIRHMRAGFSSVGQQNRFNFDGKTEDKDRQHADQHGKNTFKSTATLDDTFLGFGVSGKHACPGRFFALVEMKIFIAEVLLNYDVEYLPARPPPLHLLWLNYPSNASIRIRKRSVT